MAVVTAGLSPEQASASFEIKSAQLSLVALMLKTSDWTVLSRDFARQFGAEGDSPDFFDNDAVLVDFSSLPADADLPDLSPLLATLRSYRLWPVAARGGNPGVMAAALAAGLVAAPDVVRARPVPPPEPVTVIQEVVREVMVEVPVEVPVQVAGPGTMVVDKPLRSGQKIYARGCDLVVLAMVNQGAEVVADGNIHVYAPLRGKAMAGARGNTAARIFSTCLEPELISIAGIYRTSETPLPEPVRGKPAQVRLAGDDLDKLLIEPLKS